MKLFYSINSPYARKARVVAMEKGIADRIEQVMVDALANPPELLAVNPLGKIPALVRDDGSILCDSPLICEYFDSLTPTPPLFPEGEQRWPVLQRAALAHGVMDAAVALVVEGRKPEQQRSPMWAERHHGAIMRTLGVLAKHPRTSDRPLTIAAINLAVALAYISFRHPNLPWRATYPMLAEWLDEFNERDSMQATRPQA